MIWLALLVLAWPLVGVWLLLYDLATTYGKLTLADVVMCLLCGSIIGPIAIVCVQNSPVIWRKK